MPKTRHQSLGERKALLTVSLTPSTILRLKTDAAVANHSTSHYLELLLRDIWHLKSLPLEDSENV